MDAGDTDSTGEIVGSQSGCSEGKESPFPIILPDLATLPRCLPALFLSLEP